MIFAANTNDLRGKAVSIFFLILAKIIAVVLDVTFFAMMARALLPLFLDVENSKFFLFITLITEPFIIPVRALLIRFNWLQNSPIDWSFTITYIILMFVRLMLPPL